MADTTSTTTDTDSIELDDLAHHIAVLRKAQDEIDRLNNLKSEIRGKIKKRMGDIEIGTVAGLQVVTWKLTYRVALIPKLVKQLHPEVIHDCEDVLPVRTFLLLDTA